MAGNRRGRGSDSPATLFGALEDVPHFLSPRHRFPRPKQSPAGEAGGGDPRQPRVFDLLEADPLQQVHQIPHGDRARDSLGPGVEA